VFRLRATSLFSIASTLKLASDKKDSPGVAGAALASYAALLTASDVDWEQLYKLEATQILSDRNITGVVVPASQIVTSPDIVSAHSLGIAYQRVGTPTRGGHVGGVHGSALISTTAVQSGTPTQLSTTATTTVSASTSSLVIDVVIEDSGDYPEVNVPVTLTVMVGGKIVGKPTTQKVSQLAALGQATVAFSNLQIPTSAFGANASISVEISKVPGEAKLDNNSATYPVLFQLSPS
jgi:hypothetical protein